MLSVQRDVLDEIMVKMRTGRMTRRSFLERAIALGLTSSVATSLLEACAGNTTTIVWESEHDSGHVYSDLVNAFNTQPNDIYVMHVNGPVDTGLQHNNLIQRLQVGSSDPDVFSMDVTWVAEFANKKWTLQLDKKGSIQEQNYLPGSIEGCKFNGHLWAAPFRVDAGLIYYRKDLIATPPTTWNELTVLATHIQSQSQGKMYGYAWQGAQYEGLVCNFLEVLMGYGGAMLAPNNPTKVTVNTPEAVQALTTMVNWVSVASPLAVTTYKEEDARAIWQQGYAALMRNWPYAYALGNDGSTSVIVDKFDVHPMLYGGSNTVGHSCIGGWQLGINARSRNPDAAWTFIQYMLSPDAQKLAALNGSLTVTLSNIYQDSDVLKKNSFFAKLGPVFREARSRPISLKYPTITTAIQSRIHQALTKQSRPADALNALQNDLERIVST